MRKINNSNKHLSIDIMCKPIEACNQNCFYCFDKKAQSEFKREKLDLDLLHKFCHQLFSEYRIVNWTWHGGEILLVGKEWFREASFLIYETALRYGSSVNFFMQTNGTLIDEEWKEIFLQYNISASTSDDVVNNELSRGYTCPNENFLSKIVIINKYNKDHLIEIYEKLKEEQYTSTTFNFGFITKSIGLNEILGDPIDAIEKYWEFFKYYIWDKNNPNKLLERTAKSLIDIAFGKNDELMNCNFTDCTKYNFLTIAPNGDLYHCDNLIKEFRICNIADYESSESIKNTQINERLQEMKKAQRLTCGDCKYLPICNMGCTHCSITESNGEKPYSFYCEMIKMLIPRVEKELGDLTPQQFYDLNPVIKKALIQDMYLPLGLLQKAKEGASYAN